MVTGLRFSYTKVIVRREMAIVVAVVVVVVILFNPSLFLLGLPSD
jgi:hypothetical protein